MTCWRRRLFEIATVAAAIGASGLAPANASASPVSSAQAKDIGLTPAPGSGPFDSQTVFCKSVAPPPGKRNFSSPGVTPSSVTIVDNSIDAAALKKLGVNIAEFHLMYQVFVDEINKCGGVNGRKLILKSALYSPLAPDQQGHFQAICLKTTEDFKAFYALGAIGAPPGIARCIAVQHKTIYDAPAYATDAEFRDSKGRLFSIYPAGDKGAEAFIADGVSQHLFDNKKITILGSAAGVATVVAQQRDQFQGGLKKVGIDADLEILPCDGVVCTKGIGSAVRRIKANGTNMIVLTTNITATAGLGTFFREMSNQNVSATVVGPTFGAQHQDASMAAVVSQAGPDGLAWMEKNGWRSTGAEKIGEWRDGRVKESTFSKMCQKIFAKATAQPLAQLGERDITISPRWGAIASTCINVRAFARALYSLGNNVTTERMVAALKVVKPDRRDTGANPRELYSYTRGDDRAPLAITLQVRYPCPLPQPRPPGPAVACAMPVDSPLRFRTIRY